MRERRALALVLLALCSPAAATAAPTAPAAPASPTAAPTAPTAPASPTAAPADPNALVRPTELDEAPAAHRLTPRRAIAIAKRVPKIADLLRRHPGTRPEAYEKGLSRWQVSFFAPGRERRETGQVLIDDATGAVLESWTGFQVAWTMARGYPGAFGRVVTSLWIWVPLSILFAAVLFDWRRPWRWWNLDLLALSAFSISLAFFDHAQIGVSVPIVAPLLAYLLARMLAVALGRGRVEPVRPLVPVTWLAVATVFLIGFRIGLNATSSNVIDVGYAGVIGADRLTHGEPLYGHFPSDNEHGDTYGPVVYETYVPFEQLLPWSGRWDDLPAAHVAAVLFDLLCVLLLFLLGRRVRGPSLGIVLAYAWCSYPFTLYAANSNTNDALVTLLILLALLAAARPAARGAAAALAGLTKFAPLALAPVLATHGLVRGRRAAGIGRFVAGFALAAAVAMLPVLLGEDLGTFYDRTVGFQASRGSPFSLWGLRGWTTAQHVVQAVAVLLAVVLAFVPRRPGLGGLAATCGAVLLALQLGVTHWFYLYVVWFFPLVLLATLAQPLREPARA